MAVMESGTNVMPGYGLLRLAAAPVNNTTFLGTANVGQQAVDLSTGVVYVCTVSTASVVTWVKIGLQT
jgi:hypothetical protein